MIFVCFVVLLFYLLLFFRGEIELGFHDLFII